MWSLASKSCHAPRLPCRCRNGPSSRKGTRWNQVLQVLAAYRLIAPGSEWKLHRDWFGTSAMADLLGADFGLAESHKLYACHDFLLQRLGRPNRNLTTAGHATTNRIYRHRLYRRATGQAFIVLQIEEILT